MENEYGGVTYGSTEWKTMFALAAFSNEPKTLGELTAMRPNLTRDQIVTDVHDLMGKHQEYVNAEEYLLPNSYSLTTEGMRVLRNLGQFSEPSRVGDSG